MKKFTICLSLLIYSLIAHAQNGLENIIVEKYYVSNAADSIGSVGLLPVGSVTYRIYVDLLPNYKFQAAYGVPGHELRILTSTGFFNNEDRGVTTPTFTKSQARNNTVMLDSWLTVGAGCASNFGILKSEDDGVATNVNLNGILQNNDPAAGIALTVQDGLIAGAPQAITPVGINSEIAVFNNISNAGNSFITSNGSWASLNGSTGPTAANRVLIGQFTTNGCFAFELNIQIGTPTGGVQNFVARNPVGNEIVIPSLKYNVADVSITQSVTNPICAGSNVTFTATPTNGGTSPSYQWKKNGANVGVNSATYTDNNLANNDQINCVITSNALCAAPSTSNTLTITTIAQTPNINSFTPLAGTIGTVVTISGTGFIGITDIKFNGISATTYTVVNANQINATVPANATTGRITVFNNCGLSISAASFVVQGLEGIIVEKYYISNAADSVGSVGLLPVGSTTYRIYADMLPNYKFQAAYGVPGHTLTLQTTTGFFNNEDRGVTTPTFTKSQSRNNTVMLDSWLTVGAGCASNFGILKSEDDGVATNVNLNGILQNNDPAAGIALTVQDGLIAGAPQAITPVGINSEITVFNNVSNAGNIFTTANGSWASLNGSAGPNATTNKVLIAQITTNGCFSFELNIQIGTPSGGVQNYVARNPVLSEIQLPSLLYNAADVFIVANPSGTICAGTNVTFTATTINGGTSPFYQWKKNGANVGSNSSTYTDNSFNNGDVVTCVLSSNVICANTTTSNEIIMNVNPILTPSVIIIANPNTPICVGTNVAFNASALNGGTNPTYQWKKNGVNAGINSPVYSNNSLINGDQVTCVLTSNANCITGNPATSNPVSIVASYCTQSINLRLFIEGLYIAGTDSMMAVVDPINYPNICDTISVSLVDSATLNFDATTINVINTNGYGNFSFTGLLPLHRYYIVIKNRNAIETWSKYSYLFDTPNLSLDFTRP